MFRNFIESIYDENIGGWRILSLTPVVGKDRKTLLHAITCLTAQYGDDVEYFIQLADRNENDPTLFVSETGENLFILPIEKIEYIKEKEIYALTDTLFLHVFNDVIKNTETDAFSLDEIVNLADVIPILFCVATIQ